MTILFFCMYFIFSVGGLTLYKLGAGNEPISWVQSLSGLKISWVSVGGLVCYAISFLIYMHLLSKLDVSLVYPIATGICAILILIVSAFVLHETVHPLNWLGVGVILIGIFLVSYGRH